MFTVNKIKELVRTNRLDIFYNSWSWRKLSKQVIREHHNECYMCRKNHKVTPATLVHHVKPLREYPELAYSRSYGGKIQLMPLCHDCHERIHGRTLNISGKNGTGFTNIERW